MDGGVVMVRRCVSGWWCSNGEEVGGWWCGSGEEVCWWMVVHSW